MAVSADVLVNKSTVELVAMRADYQRKRRDIPRFHRSSRTNNLSTDIRRCDDAIRLINSILKVRQRSRRVLSEFRSC
jgi:hypothetical protein